MTGQMTHLIPILVATIVATLIAQRLGPSIYDSLIKLKKLPYLPPLIQSGSSGHRIFVENFMEKDLLYVWEGCTYRYLRHLLNTKKHLNVYPYVKSPESMILLGTVERVELQYLLENHLSKDRMIEDLKKKPTLAQGLNKPSPTCPIHGQQPQRFQVATIPENEVLEVTTVGVSFHFKSIIRMFYITNNLFSFGFIPSETRLGRKPIGRKSRFPFVSD